MKSIYIVAGIVFLLLALGFAYLFSSGESNVDSVFSSGTPYKEIVKPGGFVNTNDMPIMIADYVGKNIILLDVMTYSCINCQRTFPYVTAWYEKYKDDGLMVIGIHTPEFAFEKNKKNVEEAMKKFSIDFPVVLDNEYGTWNAYGNNYWPRKYLIDIHGNIVYDHIGEGGYEEIEMKIRELLEERARVLGAGMSETGALAASTIQEVSIAARSPETYFGSARNEYLANGTVGRAGAQQLVIPGNIRANALYLGGKWNFTEEYAETEGGATIMYRFSAKGVYLVADSSSGVVMEVLLDGKPAGDAAGADVGADGTVRIQESRLYKLIESDTAGEHTLELRIKGAGFRAYAFTFG